MWSLGLPLHHLLTTCLWWEAWEWRCPTLPGMQPSFAQSELAALRLRVTDTEAGQSELFMSRYGHQYLLCLCCSDRGWQLLFQVLWLFYTKSERNWPQEGIMRSLQDMMKPVCVFFPHFIGLAPPFFHLPLPSWTSLHRAKWPYLSPRLWSKKAFVRIPLSISE